MIRFSSIDCHQLIRLSEPIRVSLSKTNYVPPEGQNDSVKALLKSLLPNTITTESIQTQVRDFCLCCATLALAEGEKSEDNLLSWIFRDLSIAANYAFGELSKAISSNFDGKKSVESLPVSSDRRLAVELMPEVFQLLKGTIKESVIDPNDDGNEISAASSRTTVACAIVAAYQFRWFVTQVNYPHLGKLITFVVPCALTTMDHIGLLQ